GVHRPEISGGSSHSSIKLKVALQLNETATTWKQRLVCEDVRELKPDKIREPERLVAFYDQLQLQFVLARNCLYSKYFIFQVNCNEEICKFSESGKLVIAPCCIDRR